MISAVKPIEPEVHVDELDLVRSLCRDSFYFFVQEMWSVFSQEEPVWNWHIEFLCDEIQEMMELVIARQPREHDLICNISPGTTKSTIFSVMLTPWMWTRMPEFRSINASHTHDLVLDLSRKARDVVLSQKYQELFPEIQLRDDQNTKGYFANVFGGMRLCCTVGGKNPMGFHGHAFIVDDPLDPRKAASVAELAQANDFMRQTVPTRKIDKSVAPTMLVMQRLSQADPSGDWLGREPGIRHICLPAELTDAVRPKYLRKHYVDGLMDPVRLPLSVLEKAQSDMGGYGYAGQFLQTPIPKGGGRFAVAKIHLMKTAPRLKEFRMLCRYWDKAGTADGGAFTVGLLMGTDYEDRTWVLDVVRGQWEAGERELIVKQTAKMDTTRVWVGVEQEPGSGGKESAESTARMLRGWRVFLDRPTGDKEVRSEPFQSEMRVGNVYILQRDWTAAYIDELRHFPYGKYKDQVDASSGAFSKLTKPAIFVGGGVGRKKSTAPA